jgi:hypothetical protein
VRPLLLQVETAPGSTGIPEPATFSLRGKEFRVQYILDRWSGVDHSYFKLVADDGARYVLRHDQWENEWELVMMEA